MKDYYKVLGVKQTASTDEIKNAYLNLIKKYHPDVFKGDRSFAEQKTSQITEAYTTLKDDELRKKYDEKYSLNKNSKETNISKPKPKETKHKTDKTSIKNNDEVTKQKTVNNNKQKSPSYYYDIAIWGLALLIVVIILMFIIT